MRFDSCTSDITVVGGGLAGVCAAIAAARIGADVALVNNRPVLGGNSSSEVRVWVVGATAHGLRPFARETGIMGELARLRTSTAIRRATPIIGTRSCSTPCARSRE